MSMGSTLDCKKHPMPLILEQIFRALCAAAVAIPLLILAYLLFDVAIQALPRLQPDFLLSYPSRHAEKAGILAGLVGSVCLITLSLLLAIPLGIASAIFLEEYGAEKKLASLVETNISNLAAIPSVIYGLLGLELFVRLFGMGHSLMAGACTLALLIMPVIITTTREALRTVPLHLREAALALGATKWQSTFRIVLPSAFANILTGVILATSRAFGETAPLIVVGASTYLAYLPEGLHDDFTALPIQIFNWVSRPQKAFLVNAAAGIVVLVITLLLLNCVAIYLRGRLQKNRVI